MFIKIIFRSSFLQVEIPNNRKKNQELKKGKKNLYRKIFFCLITNSTCFFFCKLF